MVKRNALSDFQIIAGIYFIFFFFCSHKRGLFSDWDWEWNPASYKWDKSKDYKELWHGWLSIWLVDCWGWKLWTLTVVNESHPAVYDISQYNDTIYVKDYSWHKIPYYNTFHKEIFRKELNATTIDVEAMSVLRPDERHYAEDSQIAEN